MSADLLTVSAEWISWLFVIDDQLDEGEHGLDPAAAVRRLEPLMDRLRTLTLRPGSDDPLEAGLADVWHEVRMRMPADWARTFADDVRGYLQGCIWEAGNRAAQRVPDINEYLPMRRLAGAIWPSFSLLEVVSEASLPTGVQDDLVLRELRTTAADVVCWTNDVQAMEKEDAQGDVHNLAIIIRESRHCGTETARGLAMDLISLRLADFARREAQLDDWLERTGVAPEDQRRVRLHVQGLKDWMRGHMDWGQTTVRYNEIEHTIGLPSYLEDLTVAKAV